MPTTARGSTIDVPAPRRMGGADLGRQYVAARLVDEISLHVVPVLFGGGTRLFGDVGDVGDLGDLGDGHLELEVTDVVSTPSATHLRYRVVR